MSLLSDGEFAVTESVPQLDGSVAGAGNNLSVVGGEGNGEDVVCVSNKAAGGGTGRELPQTESLVPGGGERIGTVRGDDLDGYKISIVDLPFAATSPSKSRRTEQ